MRGHTDTITGLSLSPDGSYVLSNAMDNSLRIWDVRPFAPYERCVKIFSGHQHNFENNLLRCAWSKDGSKVSAGSSDRFHYIWDTTSRRILYKLPGHNGSVNDIDFHPKEPIGKILYIMLIFHSHFIIYEMIPLLIIIYYINFQYVLVQVINKYLWEKLMRSDV